MNKHILEALTIVPAIVPVSLDGGANAGDYVSMKNFGRCAIVLFKGIGTAGDDPTLTVTQAQDVSGTGAKELNFTRIDVKQGVSLAAIGSFTTITQAAGNTYTHTDAAEAQALWVVDIQASDLDLANNFDCIRCSVADVGTNAQIGAALYLLHEPRFSEMPSAIVD